MLTWVLRYGRVLLGMAGCAAFAVPGMGQDAAKRPIYDAILIKPYQPEGIMRVRIQMKPDGYSASGTSVKALIQFAYDLKMEDQISGAGSIGDKRFDIEAKMDADTVAALAKLSSEERTAQQRLMMQALLANRFKLKAHSETKELPIFSLVIAKGGSKLKEADPFDTYPNGLKGPDGTHSGLMMFLNGVLRAQGVPISSLANSLTMQVHRIVVNNTGLTGKYDFSLAWTADGATPGDGSGAESWPTLFTALQEQLGLKLDATKAPVNTVAVDHLEMPSEN